jgi:hypothetical protein
MVSRKNTDRTDWKGERHSWRALLIPQNQPYQKQFEADIFTDLADLRSKLSRESSEPGSSANRVFRRCRIALPIGLLGLAIATLFIARSHHGTAKPVHRQRE